MPQQLPLSAGEVLGCTSPRLPEDVDALVFVADGRFHLESLMIRNPHVPAFRYDPYSKRLTSEKYDTRQLHRLRRRAVAAAANASRVGLVLGALGRQGSPAILRRVRALLNQRGIAHFCLILTEVTPDTLKRFDAHVDAWVQVACPRLSVDWGHHFQQADAVALRGPRRLGLGKLGRRPLPDGLLRALREAVDELLQGDKQGCCSMRSPGGRGGGASTPRLCSFTEPRFAALPAFVTPPATPTRRP